MAMLSETAESPTISIPGTMVYVSRWSIRDLFTGNVRYHLHSGPLFWMSFSIPVDGLLVMVTVVAVILYVRCVIPGF